MLCRYTLLNDATKLQKMSPAQMFANNLGKHYILQIQYIFVETVICSFLRQQNFWKIYSSINIYGRVSYFLTYDQKKEILKW